MVIIVSKKNTAVDSKKRSASFIRTVTKLMSVIIVVGSAVKKPTNVDAKSKLVGFKSQTLMLTAA
ncbi:hypothetical protein N644_1708 [Lactiplantibacillus paraplantarum]|uniref:Uncharacterized protein n=1 Tax=Lactiplantibacillus paraplantarum TaxID=60520 RepID=A0AAD0TNP4_9LACO|nr:hypothetical protein ASU28_07125 [Lactiplantibacillus paraplantarum]KRL51654.1 hypothetical protein FD48_GL000354 [Lactiplantibacillus paraplantarum DSM 10667]OAX75005.1 hypothetical protein A0U96_04480 [Lactiplantibacillus plantarum]AVW10349.1 hypothetical protein DA077_07275 [Lactiplantibacillus paraplantarum]AYJ38595.1 hypothetical protein LP667_07100 [Lactiplantibacillus paraplantarum]